MCDMQQRMQVTAWKFEVAIEYVNVRLAKCMAVIVDNYYHCPRRSLAGNDGNIGQCPAEASLAWQLYGKSIAELATN